MPLSFVGACWRRGLNSLELQFLTLRLLGMIWLKLWPCLFRFVRLSLSWVVAAGVTPPDRELKTSFLVCLKVCGLRAFETVAPLAETETELLLLCEEWPQLFILLSLSMRWKNFWQSRSNVFLMTLSNLSLSSIDSFYFCSLLCFSPWSFASWVSCLCSPFSGLTSLDVMDSISITVSLFLHVLSSSRID